MKQCNYPRQTHQQWTRGVVDRALPRARVPLDSNKRRKKPKLFFISLFLFSKDHQWTLIAVIIEFHSFIFRQTHTHSQIALPAISVWVKINGTKVVSHRVITNPICGTSTVFPSNCCPLFLSITFSPRSLAPSSVAACRVSLRGIWRIRYTNSSTNWLSPCAQKCEATSPI